MMTLSFATPWVQRERSTNLVGVWHAPLACGEGMTIVLLCSFAQRMLLLHTGKSSSEAQICSEFYSASCACEGGSTEHLRHEQGARTYCWRSPETGEGKVAGVCRQEQICVFVRWWWYVMHIPSYLYRESCFNLPVVNWHWGVLWPQLQLTILEAMPLVALRREDEH